MSLKLCNTCLFSELKHGDFFIEESGHVGIKINTNEYNRDETPKLRALFLNFLYYRCVQNMDHNPPVQILEDVDIKYRFVQKVTKEVVIQKEVSEPQYGQLSFNEIPF